MKNVSRSSTINPLLTPYKFFSLLDLLQSQGPLKPTFVFLGLTHLIFLTLNLERTSINVVCTDESDGCAVFCERRLASDFKVTCDDLISPTSLTSGAHYDFLAISIGPDKSASHLQNIIQYSGVSISFLIVIANCDWAPTDLSILSQPYMTKNAFSFSLIEQICDENVSNDGFMLYRYIFISIINAAVFDYSLLSMIFKKCDRVGTKLVSKSARSLSAFTRRAYFYQIYFKSVWRNFLVNDNSNSLLLDLVYNVSASCLLVL
jgi:hypothetical protein